MTPSRPSGVVYDSIQDFSTYIFVIISVSQLNNLLLLLNKTNKVDVPELLHAFFQ